MTHIRIGLIDVDSHNFPNLCLMKLSAYHKAQGHQVCFWSPLFYFDVVYKSRVFTDTYSKDNITVKNAGQVIKGGTGYGYGPDLPDEIEHSYPDYSLYPQYSETAYGFLSRGCPRGCGFCIVGGKEGLQPIEKTVIDRCVRLVYRELALGIGSGDMPLLQDLYEELLKQPEPEARRVATALELYCTGSLNLFNHPTNVQTDARVVCIVLKGMGENLRKIAMHITNEFVTSAVNTNHAEGLATWCYFDEFHILLRDPLTASYFVAVWKMLRKKGCVPSALTQNVKDLLASREIEAILDNTDFMILLSQAQSDRAILAKQLGISEHQLSYITHSNSGEGLLFYGSVTIPFVDRFPKGEIYNLLTTRPEDMAHERKDE